MPVKELIEKARLLIAKAKIKEVFELLLANAAQEKRFELNELLALSAKYHDLESMQLNNSISYENYQTYASKVQRSLIEYVDNLAMNTPSVEAVAVEHLEILSDVFKTSIGRTQVLEVLLQAKSGLTIKEISEQSGLTTRKFIIHALDELIGVGIVERYKLEGRSLNRLAAGKKKVVAAWF